MTLFKGRNPGGLFEADLRKFKGLGPLFDYLRFSSLNTVLLDDDFLGDAINTDLWAAITPGATATLYTIQSDENGTIKGIHGTTAATSGLQWAGKLHFRGDRDCGMLVRLKVDTDVSELRVEVGFADALPAINTNVVNSLATPTFNTAADVACWVYDHASSTTTSGLYTDGAAITAAKTAGTVSALVADTYKWIGLQISGDFVQCFEGGANGPMRLVADRGRVQSIEGGNAVLPFVASKLSDTTDCAIFLDRVMVWGQRV